MTTQSHYEGHSASSYESAYFYSPGAYTEYLARLVVHRLGLGPTTKRRILDVGGGTGNFTRMILEESPLVEAIVVDPYLESSHESDNTTLQGNVKFVKAPAEDLGKNKTRDMWWRQEYHQVLFKEVVHHLDAKDRAAIFQGIHRDTSTADPFSDPSILIITRPQVDIDYPLWKEARKVWAENQPSLQEFQSELKGAGFTRVSATIKAYPCEIELEKWLQMVKGRFWSTFSNFTDYELEQACQNLRFDEAKRIDDQGVIHFEDRLLFISAFR